MTGSRVPSARAAVLDRFAWVDGHADVWAVFRDPHALRAVVRALAEPFATDGITAVCGIESRGFLLGAATAVELGVGFVPIRKAAGLLPGVTLTRAASPDYRGLSNTLRLQRSALTTGDRVVLVDDWIETGSQADAARSLVIDAGADWAGCGVIVDQLEPSARARFGRVHSIVLAAELPPG